MGTMEEYWRNRDGILKRKKIRYDNDPERFRKHVRRSRCKLQLQRRHQVIEHYGSKCRCCGETTFEFLAIDHINGNGAKHRRQLGNYHQFLKWIIKNGFPTDLRVLCHNCNFAIHRYKKCPHDAR